MAAACAPGDAVQQKIAIAGSSSCLRAHVFGPIVPYDVADCFESRPVDVGGIRSFTTTRQSSIGRATFPGDRV